MPPPSPQATNPLSLDRDRPGRPGRRGLLVLLLASGLALRLLAAGYSGPIKRDGAFYAELGSRFARGDFAGLFHPKSTPLYPFLLGLADLVVRDAELAGLVVSVAAGTLTIALVYWLGRMLFDERVGLTAAGLAAVHPFLVRYSGHVMTEATYTLTFALALGAIWWALARRGWWRYALAGAAVGLSYLARLEGMGLGALLALGTVLPRRRRPAGQDRPGHTGSATPAGQDRPGHAGSATPAGQDRPGHTGSATPAGQDRPGHTGSATPAGAQPDEATSTEPQGAPGGRRGGLLRDLGGLLLAGVVFLAVAFPQLYFVKQQMGVWSLTPKAGVSARRYQMSPAEFERYKRTLTPDKRALMVEALFDRRYRPALLAAQAQEAPREGPARLARRWLRVLGRLIAFLPEVHGPLLLLFLTGLLYRRAYPRRPAAEAYLGACLVLYLAALAFFQGSRRNLAALVVPMLFWMAIGAEELARVLARWRARGQRPEPSRQRRWLKVVLAASVLAAAPMTLRFAPRADWRWRGSVEKDAGFWVRSRLGPGRTILALHRTIPFYAGGRFVGLPYAPYEDVITYARLNRVDALLLEEEKIARSPELADFAQRVARDPRWEDLGTYSGQRKGKVKTYRLYRFRAEPGGPPPEPTSTEDHR